MRKLDKQLHEIARMTKNDTTLIIVRLRKAGAMKGIDIREFLIDSGKNEYSGWSKHGIHLKMNSGQIKKFQTMMDKVLDRKDVE